MLTYSQASNAARHVNFDEAYARAFDGSRPGSGVKLLRSDSRFEKRVQPNNGRARQLPVAEIGDVSSRAIEITPADVVSRRARAWDGIKVEIIQSATHDKVEFRFRNACHLLLIYEEGVRDEGETVVGDLSPSTLRTLRRKLTFVPAGHDYREWQRPRVRSRVICLYFDPAKMPIHADANTGPLTELDSYSQALGVVVAHELLRSHAQTRRRLPPARGSLAVWQQRIVTAYIEEHLDEPIPLTALAKLVHLSSYYFCRAFKQSFGIPPHRYHINRRIERAKTLLADRVSSVTEIALELGFSETSSFSAAFRHTTGITPTEYRRALA